jgi:hypothetical protein
MQPNQVILIAMAEAITQQGFLLTHSRYDSLSKMTTMAMDMETISPMGLTNPINVETNLEPLLQIALVVLTLTTMECLT